MKNQFKLQFNRSVTSTTVGQNKNLVLVYISKYVIFSIQHPIMEKGSASAMVGVYAGGDGLDPMLATLKMVVTRIDLL
jgi:hypothetical protein